MMNYRDCFVKSDMSLIDAMTKLDDLGTRILLLVDENGRLIGTLTDSDIRRWIIRKGSIEGSVGEAVNRNPKYSYEKENKTLNELIKEYKVDAVPIVDEDMVVTGIEFLYNTALNNKNSLELPIVMMAGGIGSRLYPYTRILPKPLIPIDEIPIAERIFNGFYECGCRDFWMIVNYKKEMIKAYFGETNLPYSVNFADESVPLGTGGGVLLVKDYIKDTFVLTNCDNLIDTDYSKIYEYHKQSGNVITFVCSLVNYEVPYGVVEFEEGGKLTEIKEKPSYSFFTNTGMYFVEPEVFDYIEIGEKIDFPTIAERIKEKGLSVGVYPISSKSWMDMGQFDTLQAMQKQIQERE